MDKHKTWQFRCRAETFSRENTQFKTNSRSNNRHFSDLENFFNIVGSNETSSDITFAQYLTKSPFNMKKVK